MIKNWRFVLICFLVFTSHKGQEIIGQGNFSMPAPVYKTKIIGSSYLNVYYDTKFVRNPSAPNIKTETLCILQLGEKFSKFSELKTLQKDSLLEKYSHQSNVGAKDMNALFKLQNQWSSVVLKDKLSKKYTVQNNVGRNVFQYETELPVFDWKIGKGSKVILGYNCKDATLNYAGRDYSAWYAVDIPITDGPYIFNGLPGLILEISDSKREYIFSAVNIAKISRDVYLHNEEAILNVTRDKFKQVEKAYHDNPGFYHGKAYNADGSVISGNSKSLPYNPIELK